MKTFVLMGKSTVAVLIMTVAVASAETTDQAEAKPETPDRPTIGLALGGGGAKGIAHVGVLRVLEELQIPVDYIAGTSMGAVIAGFYASGMSPEEIEALLLTIDWWDLLNDQSNRRDMPFRRKQEDHRYLLDLEVGLRGFRLLMPNGLASGQKMNNLLTRVTSPVAGINDFDELNIPFRAVATDLPTGRSVVLDQGNLARAQRASMAVPGVFAPIAIDDYLLVDGGLLNNIPVDVVQEMGADIVIAVDVSGAGDWDRGGKPFTSLGEVLGQTYMIMQRPEQDQKLAQADTVILPATADFSASDFHETAELIPLGDAATRAVRDELVAYSVSKEAFSGFLARQRRGKTPVVMTGDVSIKGNELVDERAILSVVATRPGEPVDDEQLKRDIARVYALGGFASVTCVRTPRSGSDVQDIKFVTTEKPWGPGYVRFGFNLESDFDNHAYWGLLVNYTRRHLNALSGEWRLEAQAGSTTAVHADLYQPLTFSGSVFLSPRIDYLSTKEDVFEGDDRVAEYDIDRIGAGFDAGVSMGTLGEVRAGYFIEQVRPEVDTGASDLPESDDTLGGLEGRFALDTLDDSYFPRKGFALRLWGRAAREALGADFDFDMAEAVFLGVTSFRDHTISGRVRGGTSFGSDLPGYDNFKLGGIHSFAGLARGQLRGPYVGVVSIGYRYRLGRLSPGVGDGVYLMTRGDVGNVWENDIGTDDLRYGGLVGFSADTLIGPVTIAYGRANGGDDSVHFAVGTLF